MTFSWINHVWQLDERALSVLIGMIAWMRAIPGTSSYENSSIVGLNTAEPDGNVEIYVQEFPCFLISIYVVESENFLIKFEEVDFIS